jgi:hypothetical protein
MSLAVKGSRLITVDGIIYRWRLRRRPSYNQACFEAPLTFAVELAGADSSVLAVEIPDVSHPGNLAGTRSRLALVVPVHGRRRAGGGKRGVEGRIQVGHQFPARGSEAGHPPEPGAGLPGPGQPRGARGAHQRKRTVVPDAGNTADPGQVDCAGVRCQGGDFPDGPVEQAGECLQR